MDWVVPTGTYEYFTTEDRAWSRRYPAFSRMPNPKSSRRRSYVALYFEKAECKVGV